mmetsp:Transcript_8867/g.19635  ORF Transcript_8867/g.19635 Transcript_8867/m.19635 type:complete len:202 (+) Transcript_8867:2-607(+)
MPRRIKPINAFARRVDDQFPFEARRSVFHVPILGAVAGFAVKKIALHAVVRKLGPARVFRELRELNSKLHRARPDIHPAEAYRRVESGLDAIDASLQGLREHEQVKRSWKWFESWEQNNPQIYQVLIKAYLDTLGPVKWASALLRGNHETEKVAPELKPEQRADISTASVEGQEILNKLHAAVPELSRYHIILIPKEKSDQ